MKVLIIEDEIRIAQSIKKGLEHVSYVCDMAHTGDDGVNLATTEDYDCIILDRMLPEKSGIEVCKELRAANIHTPILMLTAKSLIDDKVEGLEAGADDYLTKPFAFSELIARIKALSRRPSKTLTNTLTIDDLEIDAISFSVKRAGKDVQLSRKEYALLDFLARNNGRVYSKEELAQKVWEYDSAVLANTAQVYIGYLRSKIDKAFPHSKKLIHTIRGYGYKLDNK